jgi:hypothetical protein
MKLELSVASNTITLHPLDDFQILDFQSNQRTNKIGELHACETISSNKVKLPVASFFPGNQASSRLIVSKF